MKNRIFATLSSLTLLTAAAAFAQTSTVMQADIPFAFGVGTTTLPAGHYDVRPQITPGVVSIRCFECKAGAMISTNAVERREIPETGKLVFNRYGNKYFLSSVWTPGYSQGRGLHQSKAEREYASNSSAGTPVAIALARR